MIHHNLQTAQEFARACNTSTIVSAALYFATVLIFVLLWGAFSVQALTTPPEYSKALQPSFTFQVRTP
jgi:hypothetical protein